MIKQNVLTIFMIPKQLKQIKPNVKAPKTSCRNGKANSTMYMEPHETTNGQIIIKKSEAEGITLLIPKYITELPSSEECGAVVNTDVWVPGKALLV